MIFRDSFRTAVLGLKHAKMRSFLTMLGIVIGITSVILLMAIGTSAQDYIIGQVQGVGSNLVFIIPGATKGSRFSAPVSTQGIIIKTLVKQDADALRIEPSISGVSPSVSGLTKIVYGNNDTSVSFQGVGADFFRIRNFGVDRGNIFTSTDIEGMNRVAVLGPALATTLFGEVDPIGKSIRLRDLSFRVIGVLQSKGVGPFGVDQDNLVLVPLSVAQKQLVGIDYFNSITVQANETYDVGFVKSRITSILRQNHRIDNPDKDDFTVRSQDDSIELLSSITSVLTLFLTAIAFISLIVGGIGIMNIMLVSVVERTREIGLRKALGATDRDIMQQFLIESVLLTVIGGVVGIALGALFAFAVYLVLSHTVSATWTFSFPLSAVLLSASVASVTGLVFGLYPARQAAKKSPIEALRYE